MTDIEKTEREESKDPKERASDVADAAERVVHTLFDVGRLWAAHGLGVGRSALEASATTLRTTAELLGDLSQKVGKDEEVGEDEEAA